MKIRILNTWILSLGIACAVSMGSDSPDSALDQARRLLDANDIDGAVKILNTLVLECPKDPEVRYLLGVAYFSKKAPELAIDRLEEAISLKDDVARFHSMLAGAKIRAAQGMNPMAAGPLYMAALDSYKRSVALDGDHLEGHLGLIRYYANAPEIAGGSLEKAGQHAMEVKRVNPFKGYAELAALAIREKKFEAALSYYDQAIELKPDSAWIHFRKGLACQMNGDLAAAEASFQQAIEKDPGFENAQKALSRLKQPPHDSKR